MMSTLADEGAAVSSPSSGRRVEASSVTGTTYSNDGRMSSGNIQPHQQQGAQTIWFDFDENSSNNWNTYFDFVDAMNEDETNNENRQELEGAEALVNNEMLEWEEYDCETRGVLDDYKCPICLDTFINTVTVDCSHGHKFCNFCIQYWMSYERQLITECPVCRGVIFNRNADRKTDSEITGIFGAFSETTQRIRQTAIKERLKQETQQSSRSRARDHNVEEVISHRLWFSQHSPTTTGSSTNRSASNNMGRFGSDVNPSGNIPVSSATSYSTIYNMVLNNEGAVPAPSLRHPDLSQSARERQPPEPVCPTVSSPVGSGWWHNGSRYVSSTPGLSSTVTWEQQTTPPNRSWGNNNNTDEISRSHHHHTQTFRSQQTTSTYSYLRDGYNNGANQFQNFHFSNGQNRPRNQWNSSLYMVPGEQSWNSSNNNNGRNSWPEEYNRFEPRHRTLPNGVTPMQELSQSLAGGVSPSTPISNSYPVLVPYSPSPNNSVHKPLAQGRPQMPSPVTSVQDYRRHQSQPQQYFQSPRTCSCDPRIHQLCPNVMYNQIPYSVAPLQPWIHSTFFGSSPQGPGAPAVTTSPPTTPRVVGVGGPIPTHTQHQQQSTVISNQSSPPQQQAGLSLSPISSSSGSESSSSSSSEESPPRTTVHHHPHPGSDIQAGAHASPPSSPGHSPRSIPQPTQSEVSRCPVLTDSSFFVGGFPLYSPRTGCIAFHIAHYIPQTTLPSSSASSRIYPPAQAPASTTPSAAVPGRITHPIVSLVPLNRDGSVSRVSLTFEVHCHQQQQPQQQQQQQRSLNQSSAPS